jgi:hypothetical protein
MARIQQQALQQRLPLLRIQITEIFANLCLYGVEIHSSFVSSGFPVFYLDA